MDQKALDFMEDMHIIYIMFDAEFDFFVFRFVLFNFYINNTLNT